MPEFSLKVEGMHCASCANGVIKVLENQGFEAINVNYVTGDITFQATEYSLPELTKEIKSLGYEIKSANSSPSKHNSIQTRFYISLVFTLPLFFHMFLPFEILHNPVLQLILSIPVVYIGLIHFGRSAWKSLKLGVPNMDVLIFIGSFSAFLYSIAGTFLYYGTAEVHNYLFYETAATIITLVLLGNLIEHKSVKQTTSQIDELSKLKFVKAKKYLKDLLGERVIEVDYESIEKADVLVVNTGDIVPVDGTIIWGTASINESMITGEGLPVYKKEGSLVIGGTMILNGSLRIKADKVGNDTFLANIIKLVKNAQITKPEIQKIGDKVSAIFVPIVILLAAITFIIAFWVFDLLIRQALMNSIAVLVISCPCAMGLATPTAVVVGIGRAAKNGILIKKGNILENLASTDFLVFDKTGTLTSGDFKIEKMEYFHEDQDYINNLVVSLEQHSSHPIAKSLVKELRRNNFEELKLEAIIEEKGLGLRANDIDGNRYVIGQASMLKGSINDHTHSVYLTKNDVLLATIDITDELKNGAIATVQKLKSLGIKPIMLSGDVEIKCKKIAFQLGIEEYYSQQSPSQKLEIIKRLNKKGKVTMIGDGINDAPALAEASSSVSMGNAANIAVNSSEVILLNNTDLDFLIKAIQIGKHTLLTIKQNLFWAFFYNIIAIPLAAFGFLNPMLAALSMAFSDVIVIGNSIRFKYKKIF